MAGMNAARRDAAIAIVGCVLVTAAITIIWLARLDVLRRDADRAIYVSELGAQGEPTGGWFMVAMLAIVAGGSLIAWAGRRVRAEVRVLALWTPSVSLWISCGFFLFASQVTCTAGCPLPYGSTFVWQDFLHTLAAVLAFAIACWGMLQAAFARHHRVIAVVSASCGIAVGVIAATGGIFSLLRFRTDIGAWLEIIATTIAIAWVVLFGIAVARELGSAERDREVLGGEGVLDREHAGADHGGS